jgi:ER membrane protein complex subunit 7
MRLLSSLLLLGTAALALAKPTTSLTLAIPATQGLPNPNILPPSTHATLSALNAYHSAPLSVHNTFVFHNITSGSYLLDVFCPTHAFAPLRVDVTVSAQEGQDLLVRAWETFRGNDWDNKGEAVKVAEGNVFEARLLGGKAYFMERSKCEFLSVPKSCWAKGERGSPEGG